MTAQIGADGLDLLGDPCPQLLTDVARAQPQPGGEWVHLEKRLGFHSTQRLWISDLAGSVLVATWPAELARQARYLYSAGLGSALSNCQYLWIKIWSENRAFGGQAAAAGGAERRRLSRWGLLAGGGQGRVGVGGQGFDGDFVAEAFQALEVVAGLAAGTGALVVVAGAEVVVAGGGVR